ncbi:MAG: GNAT family N-acetyltransferase, partial [Thermoleophilaceae bacterium]
MRAPLLNVWPPLPPDVWLWRPAARALFPLDEDGHGVFAFGRQALWYGLEAVGLGDGDEVLVPAYNHGSEVEALVRAGLRARFHRGGETLEPDPRELDRLLSPGTRALYLIHYNGFPQDSVRWRHWCDERGLLLLEDAAQSWLAQRAGAPVGALADVAIYCAYKTYGLPEGALLFTHGRVREPSENPGRGLPALARRHGLWLAQRSRAFTSLAASVTRGREYSAERDFALRELDSRPWSTVAGLLPRLVAQDAAAARRANYRTLLRELAALVPEPFRELPDGASPFCFPVRAERKPELLGRLAERSIKALDLWSATHPAIPASDHPDAAERRATTVGLPVHQELGVGDLDRIVDAVGPPRQRAAPRLERVDDLEGLRAEWEALAGRARNVFATWEWASTWWRHYGAGRELAVFVCRDGGGEPYALLPLYLASRCPLRALRFLGHGAGDRLGPICAPSDIARTARALRRLLHDGDLRGHVLVAEQLPGDERWAALLGGTRLGIQPSPELRVRWDGFEDFLASRSRNFRAQVRRRERQLEREHQLRYRLCRTPVELGRDIEALFELHAARWAGGQSVAFEERRRAFHRDFAERALERGWLRLWTMDLDGAPAAAWYGFRFGGDEWYYQSGRDPRRERQAIGFVLMVHTVRAALEDGVR